MLHFTTCYSWMLHCLLYVCVQDGIVYAVEFSHRSGRDLLNVAKKRTNIVPIIEDARHPHKYRMLVGKLTNTCYKGGWGWGGSGVFVLEVLDRDVCKL
jgi:hypothetical protein